MKYPTAPPCRTPVNEGHMISEVIVLNLPSRSDKFWSCYGALHAVGVPTERIKRWEAMPASDYENIEALVDAAVKDGFPAFQTIYERGRCDDYLSINAQFWSYCQMLRYIAEKDITAIILYDDRYILNWGQFVKLYQKDSGLSKTRRGRWGPRRILYATTRILSRHVYATFARFFSGAGDP